MIAVCLQHHKEADGGAFTKDQLRHLKREPFLNTSGQYLTGRFNWRRDRILLLAGSNWFLDCRALFAVRGRDMVWFSAGDDGAALLNLDLFDSAGQLVLSMRDNDWVASTSLEDIHCPPAGKSLEVKLRQDGAWLNVRFSEPSAARLADEAREVSRRGTQAMLASMPPEQRARAEDYLRRPREDEGQRVLNWLHEHAGDEPTALCTVRGHLVWPFDFRFDALTQAGPVVATGNLVYGANVAFNIG
jgi:hypothetical protein